MNIKRLIDPDKLYELARDPSAHGRKKLSQAISTLLAEDLSDKERALAGDVLIDMMHSAKTQIRIILSGCLSEEQFAPKELITYLAEDDNFDVAKPALEKSAVLDDPYLIDLANRREAKHWQVIASRKIIGEELAQHLISFKDPNTIKTIIANDGANLNNKTITELAMMAREISAIQKPLLKRKEIKEDVAVEIYWYVGKALRQDILERFQISPKELDMVISKALKSQMAINSSPDKITRDMVVLAKRLNENRKITLELLSSAIKWGNIAFFSALLAVMAGTKPTTVGKIIQENKDVLLIATFKKARLSQADFTKLFLLLNAMKSDNRMTNPKVLNSAAKRFRKISYEMARMLIKDYESQQQAS